MPELIGTIRVDVDGNISITSDNNLIATAIMHVIDSKVGKARLEGKIELLQNMVKGLEKLSKLN